MTPEDVGYCRTSLTSGVLYLLLFSVLAVIILYQCFSGYFRCELLFIGIVTFVNLGKTNPDFPNNWYQSQGSAEYALWLQCYMIFHIRKGSFVLFAFLLYSF